MWLSSDKTHLRLPGQPAAGAGVPPDDPWDVLERFARELAACPPGAAQLRCAVRAARDALRAGAVYFFPGTGGESVELLSDRDLSPAWCRAFAQKLLNQPFGLDDRLLRPDLPPAPDRSLPSPRSAALVRLSRTNGSWLVALSFPPARALEVGDLKALALVRQLLIQQHRRDRACARMSDTLYWLVHCLTASIDAKIPDARGHSERVAQAAVAIGRHMGLPKPVLTDLYFAGLLHDIGLTGVREAVLLKPGRLTDEEFTQVKQAPVIGERMLAGIGQLAHLRPAVRSHHEWYDGRGYPDGLAGDQIPLLARILSVADGYDALTSPRPYRPALSVAQGEAVMAAEAGKRWDPRVVEHFLACRPGFVPVRAVGRPEPPRSAARGLVDVWELETSGVHAGGVATGPW
jgi:HD-GYP domain-containing protein (c-di-GMP phosphodiesterase class II)